MPIKGVSDIRRLPRLGKIRLGEKALSPRGKEYPKAVDYFICPPEVQTVYGDKPRVLDIMFPVNDHNVFFPQWYKRYGSSTGLACRGDGETAMTRQDSKSVKIRCIPSECNWYLDKQCRQMGNLQFLLPKVPGLGVWQIDSTSYHSIVNINSGLEMVRAVAGRVNMLPLQLVLKPQDVSPDGKKKTVYVLDLAVPVVLGDLLANAQGAVPQLLMPAQSELIVGDNGGDSQYRSDTKKSQEDQQTAGQRKPPGPAQPPPNQGQSQRDQQHGQGTQPNRNNTTQMIQSPAVVQDDIKVNKNGDKNVLRFRAAFKQFDGQIYMVQSSAMTEGPASKVKQILDQHKGQEILIKGRLQGDVVIMTSLAPPGTNQSATG